MRATGIDVSAYQPLVAWDQVYASGVRLVGIKATEKLSVDSTLRVHRDGYRQQPFTLGFFYHFARSGDPEKQAERLLDAAGPLRDNERLCLDFERLVILDHPPDNLQWIETFFDTFMHGALADRRPLLYTSARWWKAIGNPDWDLASQIDLILPRYSDQMFEPELPKPWANIGYIAHQWTDGGEHGPHHVTPGVGECDASFFNGDDDALAAYAKLLVAC